MRDINRETIVTRPADFEHLFKPSHRHYALRLRLFRRARFEDNTPIHHGLRKGPFLHVRTR